MRVYVHFYFGERDIHRERSSGDHEAQIDDYPRDSRFLDAKKTGTYGAYIGCVYCCFRFRFRYSPLFF